MTTDISNDHRVRDLLLADRVRNSVPLRHPAYGQLLQLLSVEVSSEVPTAAVTLGARSRLLLNGGFVEERCKTEEHLCMLVLHELYHVLLGHTRMYRRSTLRANWAFDCIINAQLCRLHPSPAYTSFFSALAAQYGPWSLVGPPAGWPDDARYEAGALGDVHRRLYEDDGVTTAELFALLDNLGVSLGPLDDAERRLLGNHGEDGDFLEADADPNLNAELRRIVSRWPMVVRRNGADDGAEPRNSRVSVSRNIALRRAVARLLRGAAQDDAAAHRSVREDLASACLAWPQAADRRAILWQSQGGTPLLWQGIAFQKSLAPIGRAVVYLDVSGSFFEKLPSLLDALSANPGQVEWPVQGFSTKVFALTRRDVAKGAYRSTGGTNIACVTRHILENRVRRAVIITDGEVLDIPVADLHELRMHRPGVRVGITDGGSDDFARAAGWRSFALPAFS